MIATRGGLGLLGLWLGLDLGMLLLVCGVLTYIGCLDWRAAAERAAKRAQGDSAVGRLGRNGRRGGAGGGGGGGGRRRRLVRP